MQSNYEKLGVFYLGKEYDLAAKKAKADLLLYDSKDLVTHAVVLGMTGSGKTGLCVSLIEEAAIDGVPSILIDPKGDLCNLMLTFPDLDANSFLPWINEDEARQKGLSPEDYAVKQAQQWKDGLASWEQAPERIQRLRDAADFRIYTPASDAGIPVSILKSFAAPSEEVIGDAETMRTSISTTVTSLLGLIGIEANPVQSREFILLSTIIDTLWREGRDLDLAQLISLVQTPPMNKIGVLDLEAFYPSKDRFALVMALNNLLASPGFSAWLEGEPLDIQSILYTPEGKPRVAIFSIAHLDDTQRMFFVSLLLNQVLGWMRRQSGTSSLRALLYMDEIFGYLPPLGNPSSKIPLLTLLKQARAFGLGLVLATQNPVDLDYKALSNAGTWFIGRLQTERDKARVLDGLEGAASSTGSSFNRQDIDKILSGLGSRVFLLNNTHEDEPVVMTTRWALSYLRGPLTREQIRTLMAPIKSVSDTAATPVRPRPAKKPAATTAAGAVAGGVVAAAVEKTVAEPPASEELEVEAAEEASTPPPSPRKPTASAEGQPPALSPEIQQYYLPTRGRAPSGAALVYQPRILGAARIAFAETKSRVNVAKGFEFLTELSDGVIPVDWEKAEPLEEISITDLEKRPAEMPAGKIRFARLPSVASIAKNYTAWTREFTTWLYGSQVLELLYSPSQKAYSKLDETERDFRARIGQGAREQRDDAVEALRKKYTPKLTTLKERLRKAEQAVAREKEQVTQSGMQTAISIGATLLGAFAGRKSIASNVGRATTAARGIGRSIGETQDVGRAKETVEAIQQQLNDLTAQFEAEAAEISSSIDPASEELQTVTIKPKKTDINVQLLVLAWAPYWVDESGTAEPAW